MDDRADTPGESPADVRRVLVLEAMDDRADTPGESPADVWAVLVLEDVGAVYRDLLAAVVQQVAAAVQQVAVEALEPLGTWLEDQRRAVVAGKDSAVSPHVRALVYQMRFQSEGVVVPFDAAVRLVCDLRAVRPLPLPYHPATEREECPDGQVPDLYDYEMLAVKAHRDQGIPELIEVADSERVAWEALEMILKSLRTYGHPIPDELRAWAFDVADGTRVPPTGRRRSTAVRNVMIIDTVHTLVGCGLKGQRNEASEEHSACDAVAQALELLGDPLSDAGVEKVWKDRNKPPKRLHV